MSVAAPNAKANGLGSNATSSHSKWRDVKTTAGVASDGAILFLTSVKESSDVFPPLKSAAAGILVLVDMISNFKRNQEEWQDLGRIVAERVAGIAKHVGTEPSPDLEDSLTSLNRVLQSITEEVQRMQTRGRVTKALSVQADKEKITSFYARMKNELDTLSLLANLTVLKISAGSGSQLPATPLDSDVNWVPPPPPIHFYGRDEYVQTMLNCIDMKLKGKAGAHLLIRGPGGMGKTTVAQTLFHHERIETAFGENRHFVRCEAASNQPLLLSAIASALHLDITRKDALTTILASLRAGKDPVLLVLDNAETFWHAPSREAVRTTLQHLSTIKRITLIMTMRGIEQPTAVKWDPLPPLESLALTAARETYMAIAEISTGEDSSETFSKKLDDLLTEVDCVPLAITLLARVSQTGGGDVSSLRARLRKEKSDLLNLGPIDREDNLGISIKLSLESQLMKQNPNALRLLRVLALLPAGALVDNLESITAMQSDEARTGRHTLKHLLLASESHSHRLTSLSPVRLYIMKNYPPNDNDLEKLQTWHVELASSAQYIVQNDDYPPNLSILSQEKGNLASVLELMITTGRLDAKTLTGVFGFSRFLADFDIPDGTLLELVLTEKRKGTFVKQPNQIRIIVAVCLSALGHVKHKQGDLVEAECLIAESGSEFKATEHWYDFAETLLTLGNIYLSQGQYTEALVHIERAKAGFTMLGRKSDVANCLLALGDANRICRRYDEAEQMLKEARSEFQKLGNSSGLQHNAARCLYSLGEMFVFQSKFSSAEVALEQARSEFENISNRQGLAPCLRSLGNVKRLQLQFTDAKNLLESAVKEFRALGFRRGIAECLFDLGDMSRYQHNYSDAQRYLVQARAEFENMGDRASANKSLYTLADLKISQGIYTEAEKLLAQAQEEYLALNRPFDIAQCLFSLGNSRRFQSDYAGAETFLMNAKVQFDASDAPYNAALCLQHLGDMKMSQSLLTEATKLLQDAKAIFQSLGRSFDFGKCLSSLGKISMQESNYSEAEQLFDEARATLKTNPSRDATLALVDLAEAKRKQSLHKESEQLFEEARAECKSLGIMQYTAARCLYTIGEIKYDRLSETDDSAGPGSSGDRTNWSEMKMCLEGAVRELRELSNVQPADLGVHIMKFGGYAIIAKDYNAARLLLEESAGIFQAAGLASLFAQSQQFLSAIFSPEDLAAVVTHE